MANFTSSSVKRRPRRDDLCGFSQDPDLPTNTDEITHEHISEKIKPLSSRILANWTWLKEVLDRHELTIRKRWTKKTKEQRRSILLDNWPNMATQHRSDVELYRKVDDITKLSNPEVRDTFLWPRINQEDLLKPKIFLLLLNARGRHHPSNFASFDADSYRFVCFAKAMGLPFLGPFIVMLNGITSTSAKDYGELRNGLYDRAVADLMTSGVQFYAGVALRALEVQDRLMPFLVSCSSQILHEILENALLSSQYPTQPEPLPQSDVQSVGFHSVSIMREEAPYRLPIKIDLARMFKLLSAREAAAEDHIMALREDPNYFAHHLSRATEHRVELVGHEQGRPDARINRDGSLRSRIAESVVAEAYIALELFTALRAQAQQLQQLEEKYKDKLCTASELPEEYLDAILRFQYHLNFNSD